MPAYRETLAEGVPLTLLRLPAGSFWMGSPMEEEGRRDHEQEPQRQTVAELLLGQTPVTQAQWRAVAQWKPGPGEVPWELELDPDPAFFKGANRPVERVSWFEAEEFCRRLRQRTGKNYRLPSEVQWEYACRAGTTTPFHFGKTITSELANYDGRQGFGDGPPGENRQETTEVASFPANAWGLHDLHGNVWEWCADDLTTHTSLVKYDWRASVRPATQVADQNLSRSEPKLGTTLTQDLQTMPGSQQSNRSRSADTMISEASSISVDSLMAAGGTLQPPSVEATEARGSGSSSSETHLKLLRGGAWGFHASSCRSASRHFEAPEMQDGHLGFRVCCLPAN
ncbi:MAG: formylglycine-generating enzyme family protein [Synechococcaceae cyanobacterium]